MRIPHSALAVALLSLLAGCGGGGGADTAPDGTWVGRLQTAAGHCPDTADSDLVVSATELTFVPGDGVLSLRGRRDPANPGTLHAQFLGRDINHKPLPMVFDATYAGDAINGSYGTPSCHAVITLHRPTHTGLQRLMGD